MEAALGHPDDAVAAAVQEHGPSDHAGVAAERALPQPVAEDADGVGGRVPHVVIVEEAPNGRAHPQRAVVPAGDQLAVDPPAAVAVRRQVDRPREPAEDAGEGRGPLGEGVDGPRGPHHAAALAAMGPGEGDEAVRLGHGEPLEEDGVDEGEDGGVGTDPERERGDGDPREHRAPAQAAQRVPAVLPQLAGEPRDARAPAVVPGALHATECTRWRAPGRTPPPRVAAAAPSYGRDAIARFSSRNSSIRSQWSARARAFPLGVPPNTGNIR